MTTYAATSSESLIVFQTGLLSGQIGDLLPAPDVYFGAAQPGTGAFVSGQPITLYPDTYAATLADGVQRNFLYDKIYIKPARTNLGSVVADVTIDVYVWNAFMQAMTVESLTSTGDTTGVSVLMPSNPPFDMAPLVEQLYQFTFSPAGPPTIAVVFTMLVEGVGYLIYFDGVRTRAWVVPHNWLNAIEETLEWMTDYQTTHTGKTQRAALRDQPRRAFTYKFMLTDLQKQILDNVLFAWQSKVWQVPVLTHTAITTAVSTAGTKTIPCVTTDKGFVVGGYGLLVSKDRSQSEPFQIESFNGTSITAVKVLDSTWPADTLVYPSAASRVRGNIPMVQRKANVIEGQVEFFQIPGQGDAWITPAAAPYTLNGIEVFMLRPDYVSGVQLDSEYPYDQTNYGTGVENYTPTAEYQQLTTQWDLLLGSVAEIKAFRAFLDRCKGMAKCFYAPSWTADLTTVETINSSDGTIKFKDNLFNALVWNDPARIALMIEDTSGNFYFRNITSATYQSTYIVLGINAPLGATLTTSQIRRVSFLQKYTLGSDKITMSWHSPKAVKVRLPLKGVPE